MIIGGFYDLGLREAREVSGTAVVTAPCEAACAIARALANRFSVLVGKRKWIPKMAENVRRYGHGRAMTSMRALGMGVHEFQNDSSTAERMARLGRSCVEDDGAEALILGCTAEYGFHKQLQEELGVPVIDPVLAAFKHAEFLAEAARRLGWTPSRVGGSEPAPEDRAGE